jgi:hypothetical protein
MSSAQQIAKKIFNKPPGAPKSVAFTVDEEMDMREVFEMLLMIFTEGMKILYGNEDEKVDLNARTEKDFAKVKEYFHSLGFNCEYKVYLPSQAANINFESRKYTNVDITIDTKLKELRLPLRCGPRIFEISFDFLI